MKVRDAIKMIEAYGWEHVATKGSHRQSKHPTRAGRTTIPGNFELRFAARHVEQHPKAGRIEMKYLIIIEPSETGFASYSPDLPGCVSTGASKDECEANMREAIAFHLEGLREDNEAIPEPLSMAAFVDVA